MRGHAQSMEDDDNPMPDTMSEAEKTAAIVRLLTLDKQTDNHFLGHRKPGGVGRIFGGQVVAQAMAAAQSTVDPARRPHSLHAYFLRGGDEDYRIEFSVERDFDGGSFSNRRVIAAQNGVPILNLTASFHRHEDGLSHQMPMPDVRMPEELETEEEVMARLARPIKEMIAFRRNRAYEIRMPPITAEGTLHDRDHAYFWFRIKSPLPDDMAMHRLVLAYLSDYGLLSAPMTVHGRAWWRGGFRGASLDHAVWFHSDARMDDWVLYAMDSPWSGNARGFGRGMFFTRDGQLIASTAQEGLMRVVEPKSA
jgi:acyl-CoA thioesterase II